MFKAAVLLSLALSLVSFSALAYDNNDDEPLSPRQQYQEQQQKQHKEETNNESAYLTTIRKRANMPPEWFICKTSSDCSLIPIPCSPTDLAVCNAHKTEAEHALLNLYSAGIVCPSPIPEPSSAVCNNGQCVTSFP